MRGEGKSMELLPRKPIINQAKKTQFDYDIVAAIVSAYSDIASETVSIDFLLSLLYIYIFFN